MLYEYVLSCKLKVIICIFLNIYTEVHCTCTLYVCTSKIISVFRILKKENVQDKSRVQMKLWMPRVPIFFTVVLNPFVQNFRSYIISLPWMS